VEVVRHKLHLFWLRNGHIFELVTEFHDHLGTIGTVGAPTRQRFATIVGAAIVGVEGLRKVGPVGRHLLLDLKVGLGKGVPIRIGIESAKGIHDLRLVESSLVLTWGRMGPIDV
jgi:hypothetical protein